MRFRYIADTKVMITDRPHPLLEIKKLRFKNPWTKADSNRKA